MFDTIIIGGGVIGSSIARELSRYELETLVIEKENEVCCGTTKANSTIIHAGFDAVSGTLKAKYNVVGNQMMDKLSEDLDIPFIRNGSLVLAFSEKEVKKLEKLLEQGFINGVKDLKILNRDEVFEIEPNISDKIYSALYAPSGGIVCPFTMNIALAENAYENGVQFTFDSEVIDIRKEDDYYTVVCKNEVYKSKSIVNSSGVYADKIHNMVSEKN